MGIACAPASTQDRLADDRREAALEHVNLQDCGSLGAFRCIHYTSADSTLAEPWQAATDQLTARIVALEAEMQRLPGHALPSGGSEHEFGKGPGRSEECNLHRRRAATDAEAERCGQL